jgi:hypothetical protein
MTTIAIARRFKVCQAFLGSPKSHRSKDPAKDLGPMFTQVVSTLFELMIDFEYLWKDTVDTFPTSIYGFGLGVDEKPQVVDVNTDQLHESFTKGFETYGELWEKIITKKEFAEVSERSKNGKGTFYYPSDLWARILFSFAIAYRNAELDRMKIIESLIPFYHSRILSFVNKTKEKDIKDTEEYFENVVRVFESEKHYLVKRWDEDQRKLGHKLFKS